MFPTAMAVLTAFVLNLGPVPATARVGQIILMGNVRTARDSIEKELGFCPGGRMPSEADRRKAEIRLLMKFHDRFDLHAGERPQIVIERDDPREYWDVQVRFLEKAEPEKEHPAPRPVPMLGARPEPGVTRVILKPPYRPIEVPRPTYRLRERR